MAEYTIFADLGDAVVRNSGASWATVRSATAGTEVRTSETQSYVASELEGATFNIYQGFFMFDTSVIPASETITAATFSVNLGGDNAGSEQICLTQSTQATWNSIVVGDFDQRGTTEGATRVSPPTTTQTGYFNIPLNATGLNFIARNGETKPGSASASGKTQLAIRFANDIDNVTPTGRVYMLLRMADQAGTTVDPMLVVTTSAGSTAVNPTLLTLGVG